MTDRRGPVLLTLAMLAGLGAAATTSPTQHREAVEKWQQQRDESLRDPEGWLSLVGLFWLQLGDNSFGSGADQRLPFPAPAPTHMGIFHLENDEVHLQAAEGVTLISDGKPILGRPRLVVDDESEPTTIAWGSLRFFAIRRGERVGIRVKDRRSPLLEGFPGMESYPIDPSWRLNAVFVPYEPTKAIDVPSVLGTVEESSSPGRVRFARGDQTLELDALPAAGGRLFLIFADTTNGDETYGGGRFLYAGPAGEDGSLELDFNLAYNPPCVFTPYATCPLPPRQNRLPIAVRAGERAFRGGIDH